MSVITDYPPNTHFGHLALERLRQYPDRVCQIDAATGVEETYASVLKRSISLARALRAVGLEPGDVLTLAGPNHNDFCIPHFAALFNGLPIVGVDPLFKYDELRSLFEITKPKIAFFRNAFYDTYAKVAADLGLDVKLVTYDGGEHSMKNFMEMYDTSESDDEFKVVEYDVEKIYTFLICTSGTTGKLKVAAFTSKNIIMKYAWFIFSKDKSTIRETLLLAPVSWMSSYFLPMTTAAVGGIRIQTSRPDDPDHLIDIINKYRPHNTIVNPAVLSSILARKDKVDATCFHIITLTGSKVYEDVVKEFKKLLADNCIVLEAYGQTEMLGTVLSPNPFGPSGNCGRPIDMYSVKLVDPDTGVEINEPNVTGEIYVKGPGFTEYYNDPEETANSFTEDGFYKTGDLLYRDKDNNYFFVDRIKTLIKYRGIHIYPAELEEVINRLPGVKEVCVVGIDDHEENQKPAACVVRQEGSVVTAQEIKDYVARNLSKNKELRGGVLFLDSLPHTSSGKIKRVKVKEFAKNAKRE